MRLTQFAQWAGAACLGALLVADDEPPTPSVVRAAAFELVGDGGAVRASFKIAQGQPTITLFRRDGAVGCSMELVGADDLPMLTMNGRSPDAAAILGVLDPGRPGLILANHERLGLQCFLDEQGAGGIALESSDRRVLMLTGDDAEARLMGREAQRGAIRIETADMEALWSAR